MGAKKTGSNMAKHLSLRSWLRVGSVVMFDTINFLSALILRKIQAGICNIDPIPILSANTANVSGKSKKISSVFQITAS